MHGNDAEHQADRTALLEDVAAEAAKAGNAVREIDFLGVLEALALCGRHDSRTHRDHVFVVEAFFLGSRYQQAAHPHHGKAAYLQVKVGRSGIDGHFQQFVNVHQRFTT